MQELKCDECGLVIAYLDDDSIRFYARFLCLACAYNDRDLSDWVLNKDD